jgi:DNA topoisomerase-2
MVDGLKPSQRKVLHACRKRPNKEIKVSQLSGIVSAETSYHHGEASLMGTIINMAQTYVGSNTMNLLVPNGQFGSRYQGGKDAASPRYIFTMLSEHAEYLFDKSDDNLLNYLEDDGHIVEPAYFVPTLPLILINGTEGIGTGYSTSIPCFNPDDIKHNIKCILNGKPLREMSPWYRGFGGTVEKTDDHLFTITGCWKKTGERSIEITELPIGRWTQDYKEFLESVEGSKIESFENHSSDTIVKFKVSGVKNMDSIDKDLKLTSSVRTSNMHLFNADGHIQKYDSAESILNSFVQVKLKFYEKRKSHFIDELTKELTVIDAKIKFISLVVSDELVIFKRKEAAIVKDLMTHTFQHINGSYKYLLGMNLLSLTEDKIKELTDIQIRTKSKLVKIKKSEPRDMWLNDL